MMVLPRAYHPPPSLTPHKIRMIGLVLGQWTGPPFAFLADFTLLRRVMGGGVRWGVYGEIPPATRAAGRGGPAVRSDRGARRAESIEQG